MSAVMMEGTAAELRRFKRYPEYKDSGVEWLGEIPAHWEVKPFKAVLSRNDSGVWGEDVADESRGVIVLRSTEQTVDGRWIIENPAKRRLTVREASEAQLDIGDLVVTKSSGSELHIGKTSIVDRCVAALNCCFSNFMQRLRVAQPNRARLFWYLLNCPVAREQLIFLSSTTTGLGNLNGSVLGAIRVPVAPEAEQRAIAAFLDRETARIDAMVAKKERLIELLQEKRMALITRAVTKGLDPNVPMKDSGIEWLGEIPMHWDVVPLKRLLIRCDYGISESLVGTGDVRVLTMAHIQHGEVIIPELGSVSEIDDDLFLDRHDLLFNRTNSRELVGKVGIFRGSRTDRVSFASYLVRMTARESISPTYLNFLLNSSGLLDLARSMALLSVNQANLNPTRYTQIRVPQPVRGEQEVITQYLEVAENKVIALIAQVRGAIECLKELRTALISAAVTGKIDVREEVG